MTGHGGIFLPQTFAETYGDHWQGIASDDLADLKAGPDADLYWEAWDQTLSNASFTGSDGTRLTLVHDGDLLAYDDAEFEAEFLEGQEEATA